MDSGMTRKWFAFADRDLALAEHALTMHPQPYEIICYHCQQAAEKYLKGYLIFQGVDDPPRTHDLDVLCAACSEYDERFDELQRNCHVLAYYAVQPRYPHDIEITEAQMQNALRYANGIKDSAALVELRISWES